MDSPLIQHCVPLWKIRRHFFPFLPDRRFGNPRGENRDPLSKTDSKDDFMSSPIAWADIHPTAGFPFHRQFVENALQSSVIDLAWNAQESSEHPSTIPGHFLPTWVHRKSSPRRCCCPVSRQDHPPRERKRSRNFWAIPSSMCSRCIRRLLWKRLFQRTAKLRFRQRARTMTPPAIHRGTFSQGLEDGATTAGEAELLDRDFRSQCKTPCRPLASNAVSGISAASECMNNSFPHKASFREGYFSDAAPLQLGDQFPDADMTQSEYSYIRSFDPPRSTFSPSNRVRMSHEYKMNDAEERVLEDFDIDYNSYQSIEPDESMFGRPKESQSRMRSIFSHRSSSSISSISDEVSETFESDRDAYFDETSTETHRGREWCDRETPCQEQGDLRHHGYTQCTSHLPGVAQWFLPKRRRLFPDRRRWRGNSSDSSWRQVWLSINHDYNHGPQLHDRDLLDEVDIQEDDLDGYETASSREWEFLPSSGPPFWHEDADADSIEGSIAPDTSMYSKARDSFDTYNRRWQVIDKLDPAIPWPTPTGSAEELENRSLAEFSYSNDSRAWTKDKVMEANASAFFLRAYGICPLSEDRDGIIDVTVGLGDASPEQVRSLKAQLKKERSRWHPDKLRLRNGPDGGVNLLLSEDPRAKAVFKAISDLLEVCRERLEYL